MSEILSPDEFDGLLLEIRGASEGCIVANSMDTRTMHRDKSLELHQAGLAAYRAMHDRLDGPVLSEDVIAEMQRCLDDASDEAGDTTRSSKEHRYYFERVESIRATLEHLKAAGGGLMIEARLTRGGRGQYELWAERSGGATVLEYIKRQWRDSNYPCGVPMNVDESDIPADLRLKPGGGPVRVRLMILPAAETSTK